MSQRRTSLSFPIGIVSALLILDCTAETRNWDAGESTGGAGGGAHAGSSGTTGGSGVGASTNPNTAGTTAGEPVIGGAPTTQAGGTAAVLFGGAGGLSTGSGGEQAGTAGMVGIAGTAGSPPRNCDDPTDCDDGNACNGSERCTSGICSPGSLPPACTGMDSANCRCAALSGGGCGIVGLDADGDGIKTRACAADPGLDCNDADAGVTHNACNGCATLPGAPGGSCGSCGNSKWVCSGTEGAVCSTPAPAPKQCSNGNNVQVCSAGAWITETTCAGAAPYCVVEADLPQCGVCQVPDVTRCKPGATNVVEKCSANRMSWTPTTCSGTNL